MEDYLFIYTSIEFTHSKIHIPSHRAFYARGSGEQEEKVNLTKSNNKDKKRRQSKPNDDQSPNVYLRYLQ